jgi:branched-chain amino acid transport system ATP-binding protein
MFTVENLDVFYGPVQVLWDLSLNVKEGESVALLGPNGAGKSTFLKTVSGLIHPQSGNITFLDKRIDGLDPNQTVAMGIVQVPERRRLFPYLSVMANLELGAYSRKGKQEKKESLEYVFQLFPQLNRFRKRMACTLSGGEQQMVAIGRALMAKPKFLMLDEPSLGLAPKIIDNIFESFRKIHKEGTTLLLVEQNVYDSLEICDRAYVIENGRIVLSGKSEELLNTPHIKEAYLGV